MNTALIKILMSLLKGLKTDLTKWENSPYLWMEQLIIIYKVSLN